MNFVDKSLANGTSPFSFYLDTQHRDQVYALRIGNCCAL